MMADEKFTCPRRRESAMDREGPLRSSGPGLDTWTEWPHEPDRKMCSYCGSMPPEAFWAAVEARERLIPTDKNYKVYVDPGNRKFYFQHFSPEDQQRFVALMNDDASAVASGDERPLNLASPGFFYNLPFFVVR